MCDGETTMNKDAHVRRRYRRFLLAGWLLTALWCTGVGLVVRFHDHWAGWATGLAILCLLICLPTTTDLFVSYDEYRKSHFH